MTETEKKQPGRLSPREKAALFPRSPKLAIAAYCYHDCQGEERPNSHITKNAVKECKNTACCLWISRGWQAISGGSVKSD